MIEILIAFLLGSVIFNIVLFLIAFKLQSDKLTDISYALSFMFIAISAFIFNPVNFYSLVLLSMVLIWALRIGGFLLYRVIRVGKDSRFDDMRSSFVKFGRFWLLQGITVWVLMVPVILAFYNKSTEFDGFTVLGLIIFALGFIIETVADLQKIIFNIQASNRGKWIESGLWHYSRHPNYFGEILVWLGFYIFTALLLESNLALISLISPLFISILLIFVSGIPLLEKSADKKWGNDKKYQAYKNRTNVLMIAPNHKNSN